jgi:hypothetical protein
MLAAVVCRKGSGPRPQQTQMPRRGVRSHGGLRFMAHAVPPACAIWHKATAKSWATTMQQRCALPATRLPPTPQAGRLPCLRLLCPTPTPPPHLLQVLGICQGRLQQRRHGVQRAPQLARPPARGAHPARRGERGSLWGLLPGRAGGTQRFVAASQHNATNPRCVPGGAAQPDKQASA